MTQEEQVDATDVGLLLLQNQRKEQANYTVRTVPIQAFHDARKTLETIEREVKLCLPLDLQGTDFGTGARPSCPYRY